MSSPEELFSKQLTINIELMRELVKTKDKLIEQMQLNTTLLNQISLNEKSLSKTDSAYKSSITHKFTDEHFKRIVQGLVDREIICCEDVEDIDELRVADCPCEELNGLEHFTGLKELHVLWSDSLTSLTIPELPSLKKLDVVGNESLTLLTIPELPRLEKLDVLLNNSLASLTIPELPGLKELYVGYNGSLNLLTVPERLKSITTIEYNHPDIKIEWV